MTLFPSRFAVAAALVLSGMLTAFLRAEEARILLEAGRDYPETRWFDACPVNVQSGEAPLLAVAGFSQAGQGDIADLSVFAMGDDANPTLRWRLLGGGREPSSIRTLRAADLDGDQRDELVALGRVGNERVSSRGELQVFRYGEEQWKPIDLQRWQSGQYTHGFGMDIADLVGDQRPEIITSGFFLKGEREQGELQVWQLEESRLKLIASTSWGAGSGHTRINSVCVGDVTGDGQVEIVSAGRTGQIKEGEHVTTQEADQLIVWRFEHTRLERYAAYESAPRTRSRFRELQLVDLDGKPGLEILAVGRQDPPNSLGGGPGTGGGGGARTGGGGAGTGGGGGKGTGGGRAAAEQSAPVRPLVSMFKLQDGSLKRVCNADFGDSLGEVRDITAVRDHTGDFQIVTITASELKPNRTARLDVWQLKDSSLQAKSKRTVTLGDETRARQIVLWGPDGERRVLTVGFVQRSEQILGQMLDWGSL
jgi:hypothetical protein